VPFADLTSHVAVKEATAAGIATGMYALVMLVLNPPGLEATDTELRLAQEKAADAINQDRDRSSLDGSRQFRNQGDSRVLSGSIDAVVGYAVTV
jgi:hypothetical protein